MAAGVILMRSSQQWQQGSAAAAAVGGDRRSRFSALCSDCFPTGTAAEGFDFEYYDGLSGANSHVRANSLIKAFIGGDKGSRAGDTNTDWQQLLCFAAIYPYWRIESQQHRPPAASGSSEHAADL